MENTCEHPTFTFGMDRVHGVALGGQDELYAVRSARGHWYDQAELQATDLHVYRVYEDGQMAPMADLSAVLSTVPAPISSALTSAKSTLIRPGMLITSLMPRTPW